jgi:ubiquinone/menaquinone biosynthesis C-methylase UbiE
LLSRLRNFLRRRFNFHKDPRERIISFWEKDGADFNYFKAAEDPKWLAIFWSPDSLFLRLFKELDLTRVLEIASGAGRHSFQVVDQIGEAWLLDSSAGALELAQKKMEGNPHVHFVHHPSGLGLPPTLAEDSFTAVFSYDAMVHFEKETIEAYLKAAFRILKPGGKCLLHYSNYNLNPDGAFSDNPGWRNYMTQEIFTKYAVDAGFRVIESIVFTFTSPDSDAITLLEK